MLFYEDGYIYDTDTGSKECESPALLYNLRNAGIVIEGLDGTDWRVRNKAKLKALTGVEISNTLDGRRLDCMDIAITGSIVNASKVVIVLSHYIRYIQTLHICIPCDIILDDTIHIETGAFCLKSSCDNFTLDLNRLSDDNIYTVLHGIYWGTPMDKFSFSMPYFIRLDITRFMAVFLYVFIESFFFTRFSVEDYRGVFEPYYEATVAFLIERYIDDSFDRKDYYWRAELYNDLRGTVFCSESYFNRIVSERTPNFYNYSSLADTMLKLLRVFGYIPVTMQNFLYTLQEKLIKE